MWLSGFGFAEWTNNSPLTNRIYNLGRLYETQCKGMSHRERECNPILPDLTQDQSYTANTEEKTKDSGTFSQSLVDTES